MAQRLLVTGFYICYLSLHNRLSLNSIAAENSKYLLSQFLWLGTLGAALLGRVILSHGLSEVFSAESSVI